MKGIVPVTAFGYLGFSVKNAKAYRKTYVDTMPAMESVMLDGILHLDCKEMKINYNLSGNIFTSPVETKTAERKWKERDGFVVAVEKEVYTSKREVVPRLCYNTFTPIT